MASDSTIGQLRERLAPLFAKSELDLVLVFGSVATGATHVESDLDLAVQGPQALDLLSVTNEIIQLLHADGVDVVDLRRASPLLMMEIARSGRVLYERTSGAYARFCSLAHRRYVDTKKLRVAQREAIRRFLLARGVA